MNSIKILGLLYEPLCYIRALKYLRKRHSWRNIQYEELFDILNYSRTHSFYFKKILESKIIDKDNPVSVLQTLPLLDKTIIRTEKVQSDEITEGWEKWSNTGGSTGEPLRFPKKGTGKRNRWEHLNQMMLFIKMGYRPWDKIISLDGLQLDDELINQKIYWKDNDKNFPYGAKRYSVLYLSEESIKEYVHSLNKEAPQFIRAYPSGLMLFCKLMKENHLALDFHLKACYLTSENFSQVEKDYISHVLNCPIWGQYGHTESSVFAIQDPNSSSYICSPLYGYTEVVNENGSHVDKGQIGSIVVTGFNNYGLPFIRYKTGDLAVYGGETEYGETILEELLGRDSDYLIDNCGVKKYLVGLIFGAHMHAFDCINEWQIIQNEKGLINIKIAKSVEYTKDSECELLYFFNNNNINVEFEYVSSIEKTKRGKQKFLIQNIKE